jgi:CheY-like chemotaxis protein/HPt (histidine-containing phosphotransfer) domain-containing protein
MDIETCESGIQAVDKVKNNIYDMVFLDHMMPDMDGTEACKNIRSLEGEYFKKLPVIALSANAVSGARELFLESGMNDFISKPIDAYQLNRVLTTYLPPEKIVVGAFSSLLSEKNSYEQRSGNEIIWNEEERNIFRELSAIEGLDTQKGVACVGNNAKEYFTMLKQFLAGVDANSEKIKSALQNENWKDYAILVHAYKGVLAIIGMNGLSEKAAFLETASKTILDGGAPAAETEKAAKLCKDYTDSFLDDVHNFREELLKTRLGKVEVIEKTKIDADTLKEKLNALEISCATFKAKDVELISEELKKVSFDEKTDAELEAINKLTAAFRFADAAEKIKTLRTRLAL